MKNILILTSIILIIFACSKPKPINYIYEPGEMKYGFATYQKNGQTGKASGELINYKKEKTFTFSFTTFSKGSELLESWGFYNIPQRLGKYIINRRNPKIDTMSSSLYATFRGNDGGLNGYNVDKTLDNYLEITSIDSLMVKGVFQVHYKIDTLSKKIVDELMDPDKVDYTNGKFEVKLKK